jgi:diguanylate cyclase (GGDEF)-like protein/PAS domain S-box-containing protein
MSLDSERPPPHALDEGLSPPALDEAPSLALDEGLLPRLKASEEQFLSVVANIPGAVYRCSCSDEWPIEFISNHIERIVGYPASDFIDNAVRTYGSIIHPEDRPYVADEIDRALALGAPYSLQYRVVHAEGGERWVSERGRAILGEDGERWLDGVILDVTEQVLVEHDRDRAEEALRRQAEFNRHQALHDSLTGLPNRVLFQDRVRQSILGAQRGGGQLAVLVMDLDRFKEINDTLGHASGDRFLVEAARRLQTTLRGVDSIARLGGDEFAVLLHEGAADTVAGAAERIRRAFEEPFSLDGLPLQIEASIGVAMYPAHAYSVEGLIQRADVAMYVAKTDNTGWALYDPEQDRHEPQRLSLISELRRAIDERELVLHYQPKIELRGGHVAGVEALVRWHHPTRGLVSPDEFIDVAQETSLIKPFTLYVVDEALRQCREWSDQGKPLAVAVNVSTRNLIDIDFPDLVGGLLEKHGVPPELLELEITETAIVADMFRMRTVLERLGAMGLRIAVDDFGTGYTSLGYLRRLPINELKIDRSFVSNLISSGEDEVIVRSTIDLGRNLGLEVVAEGVEDPEVLERLRQLGCDVAQGLLMSRPIPADELAIWLEELPARAEPRAWGSPATAGGGHVVGVGAAELTVADVARVATGDARAVLAPGAQAWMSSSQRANAPETRHEALDRLGILGYCAGHGELAPEGFVRAAMVVRAHHLATGADGRPEVAQSLLGAVNQGAIPQVHLLGSGGQSDRSPMAEIARALIGYGPDAELMATTGLDTVSLAPPEAATLISSNAFAAGVAALGLYRCHAALRALDLSAALSYEGFTADVSALDPAVTELRALLHGGTLAGGLRAPRDAQDPACFRGVPQAHAAARQAVEHGVAMVEAELRSSGHAHSAPLAAGLDYARLGLAPAVAASADRIQRLLHPHFSGLATDSRTPGDSTTGLAVVGEGAAALAAECRALAVPVTLEPTVFSTAAGVDQSVSLAPAAARLLYEMAGHAIRLAAVELVVAAQAVDVQRLEPELGRETAGAHAAVRQVIPFTGRGTYPAESLGPLTRWLERHYVGPAPADRPTSDQGTAQPRR